jgi:teichuronic acid biosynthesis glycosyltransferase TuaC
MNILMIAGYYPKPHNRVMGVWAHEQASVLKRRGNNVIVISPTPWLPRILKSGKISRKINDWINVPIYENYDGVDVYNLRVPIWPQIRLLKEIYHNTPNVKAEISFISMNKKLEKIIKNEKIDVIHAHGPSYEGLIAYKISKKYNIPFCVTENSAWDPVFALNRKSLKQVYKMVFENACRIIPVSQLIKEDIIKFGKKHLEKMEIVHPGVDINKIVDISIDRPREYKDNKILLSVGALEERKGHAYLIDAIEKISKSYPKIKCLIIGSESTEGESLKSKIRAKGLEDVIEIKGQLSHKDVLEYMSWCDIFILPSWFEAFGVVYAEAMSHGKPIIGVEGEGISDVIKNQVNGVLVPKKNAAKLAEEIRNLLDNESISIKIGENGKKTVSEILTWDYNAIKMEGIYKKCILYQKI